MNTVLGRGFWRVHELFQEKNIPITIFGVGMALERNQDVCDAIKKSDYEVASHGWRWIDYQNISKNRRKKTYDASYPINKKNIWSKTAWLVHWQM